jgi:hypothetical protein
VTPELQKYYENQFTMMAMPGWADLIEDLQKIKDATNNLSLVTDANDLYFRKGQIDILDLLLTRRDACGKAYEELKDETNL